MASSIWLTKSVVRNMIPWYYSSSPKITEMRTLLRYRRPLGAVNEYSAASFATDLVQMAAVVPEALSVGGNTGKVNPFTGVDLGNITGGVYQTSDLTEKIRLLPIPADVGDRAGFP